MRVCIIFCWEMFFFLWNSPIIWILLILSNFHCLQLIISCAWLFFLFSTSFEKKTVDLLTFLNIQNLVTFLLIFTHLYGAIWGIKTHQYFRAALAEKSQKVRGCLLIDAVIFDHCARAAGWGVSGFSFV